jgi:Tol biopolymer transport system component
VVTGRQTDRLHRRQYQPGVRFNVVGVRIADGTEQALTAESLTSLTSVAWLPDGSGLLATASSTGPTSSGGALQQIFQVSYPEGRPQLITNGASSYKAVSVAADSHTLIALQEEAISSLSVATLEGASEKDHQISSVRSSSYMGLSAALDGKIIYVSTVGGATDLWLTDADGKNQERLTITHWEMFPTISPDGRTVVYVSYDNQTPHLWRIEMDSGRQQQITDGDSETLPRFTPDGKFIIFLGAASGRRNLFKLPIERGTPESLTEFKDARMPAISPDGKMLACYYRDGSLPARWYIAVLPSTGGKPVLTFPLPSTIDPNNLLATMRWSPQGRALTYIADRAGSSNIWSLPLDGGEPKRITDYDSQEIFDYDWSSNGRQLVVARGAKLCDVVIMALIGGVRLLNHQKMISIVAY